MPLKPPKTYDELCADLSGFADRYQAFDQHFERFCAEAAALPEHCSVRGFSPSRDGKALIIGFFDRTLRITMRYNRKLPKGVLHVDDVSAPPPEGHFKTLDLIEFDDTGLTGLHRASAGAHLSLGRAEDCRTIVLRCIDLALDYDPWAPTPGHRT